MPIDAGGKDWRNASGEPGLSPLVIVPLQNLADGLVAIGPMHPGDSNSLACGLPCIGANEEVQELLFSIEHDGKITITTRKVEIRGIATQQWGGFQNNAEVFPVCAVVAGA